MRYKASTLRIIEKLKELYPEGLCSLQYEKDYELLFAVRLSAQCTDARVNLVTPALFAGSLRWRPSRRRTPRRWASTSTPVGSTMENPRIWWPAPSRSWSRFGGRVPDNMEDLTSLPGVGRKTANLILGDVYGQPSYVCDTHCIRITGRLGITDGSKDPVKVEQQLRKAIPPAESGPFCHRMVLFGRDVCTARSPKCEDCPLKADCAQGKKLK